IRGDYPSGRRSGITPEVRQGAEAPGSGRIQLDRRSQNGRQRNQESGAGQYMSKTRIAIIGAGNISNTRHIPALKKISEASITGVLSNKLSKAKSTAEKHGIKN